MIITGIGSRSTPTYILDVMEEFGTFARHKGWWIRSGHAEGADYAFEKGAKERCIVYLPWRGFNEDSPVLGVPSVQPLRDEVLNIVFAHEPYAQFLGKAVQKIKSRNVYQVLGENLQSPADVIVCWTPDGEVVGGTGLALKIAKDYKIPIVNIGEEWAQHLTPRLLMDAVELIIHVAKDYESN